ncbi:MAG: hypothetical protein GY820_46645 [Gammaproteobacteria bacterium]|nr:hypothetical protein [Gammaproteobacteria bacterium]
MRLDSLRGRTAGYLKDAVWDFTPPAPSLRYFRFKRLGKVQQKDAWQYTTSYW